MTWPIEPAIDSVLAPLTCVSGDPHQETTSDFCQCPAPACDIPKSLGPVVRTSENQAGQAHELTLILAPDGGTSGMGTSKLKTHPFMVGPGDSMLT